MSGLLNSGAVIALRTLSADGVRLQKAVSQVATGKAVASAADNSAAYVIALGLNSDARAAMAVSDGLAGAEVPTRVANAALGGITNTIGQLQQSVFDAQSGGDAANQANTQIQSLLSQITSTVSDATVNGVNFLAGAVGNGVQMTQITVPRNIEGGTVTIGGNGLSPMNASAAGLGLDGFSAASAGLNVTLSSLAVENITTTPPATQVEVQTANYDNTETAQYPGQSWTFVFTPAPASTTPTDSNVATDPSGNVTHVDHMIAVPVPANFSLNDAVGALQQAMNRAMFETQFSSPPPSFQPVLNIAGNNVGAATIQNLSPSLPIAVGGGGAQLTAAVKAPASTLTTKALSVPPGTPLSALAGATYLSSQAEINAYEVSNPSQAAFYLSPAGAAIAPGTTIASVDPVVPAVVPPRFTISLAGPGVTANIAATTTVGFLVPLPISPSVTVTPWSGPEGPIATLASALRKVSLMGQTLGNALNVLQVEQDNTGQSINSLDGGIGVLTDADLGQVSAQIQADQIQQQLAEQSIGLSNQWGSLLLQLFK